MAIDPEDPRCPECGEPIGARATYCMHCEADLIADDPDAADVTDADDFDTGIADDATSGAGLGTGSVTAGEASGAASTGDGAAGSAGEHRWLHPEGLLDDSLTVVVGIGAGIVIGMLSLFFLVFVTESPWGAAVALLAWLGSTAYLARRRTVFGAVERGAYAVAALLVLLPVAALTAGDGSLADRVEGFVVFEIVLGVFALIVVGVGYAIGRLGGE